MPQLPGAYESIDDHRLYFCQKIIAITPYIDVMCRLCDGPSPSLSSSMKTCQVI